MPQTIVLAFSTLDGIIEDPDGSQRTPRGGWAFRDGPVAPDHFRLGPKLDTGVLLLGRKTWELFSHIWPGRTDDFSLAMNRMPKLVASRTRTDLSAWGELVTDERRAAQHRRADQGRPGRHHHRQRQHRPRPPPSTTGWTNTASCSSPPRSATAPRCSPPRPPRSSSACCPPRPAGRPSSRGTNASPGDPDLLSPGTRVEAGLHKARPRAEPGGKQEKGPTTGTSAAGGSARRAREPEKTSPGSRSRLNPDARGAGNPVT